MPVIVVAHPNGGVGKSALATHRAVPVQWQPVIDRAS